MSVELMMMRIGFSEEQPDVPAHVAVFIDNDPEPMLAIPIYGEPTNERKDEICRTLKHLIDLCAGTRSKIVAAPPSSKLGKEH